MYMDGVLKVVKMVLGKMDVRYSEQRRKWNVSARSVWMLGGVEEFVCEWESRRTCFRFVFRGNWYKWKGSLPESVK